MEFKKGRSELLIEEKGKTKSWYDVQLTENNGVYEVEVFNLWDYFETVFFTLDELLNFMSAASTPLVQVELLYESGFAKGEGGKDDQEEVY